MNLNIIYNLLLKRRNGQFMNEKWFFSLVKKRLKSAALLQSIFICHIGLEIWSKAIICIDTHVLVNLWVAKAKMNNNAKCYEIT
jgi:hypothetical protein